MRRPAFFAILALAAISGFTWAWWVNGHAAVAEAACATLPDEMPRFFRVAAKSLGHYSGDPDRWKNPSCKVLREAESPDHFIDLEDFEGKTLPLDRWKAIALLQTLKKKPERVGMLPWAIVENYERLCCAFYDHRQDKDNAAVQAKCVVYAGVLSHFTGDAVMPLHTTIHYDGRVAKDGTKSQKGIHAKLDAFPERHGITAEEMSRGIKAEKIEDVWKHVLAVIDESHAKIDACYEFDKAKAFETPTKESRAFVLERTRRGAKLTADLWYSAWLRSATMPKHY